MRFFMLSTPCSVRHLLQQGLGEIGQIEQTAARERYVPPCAMALVQAGLGETEGSTGPVPDSAVSPSDRASTRPDR